MQNYQELQEVLQTEKKTYFGSKGIKRDYRFRKTLKYEIYRYISALRRYEYCCGMRDKAANALTAKYWALRVKLCDRKKNQLGMLLGIEITPGWVGKGIRICHQNVILNGHVGENCVFHGNNVVGNKRTGAGDEIPAIGNHVDVGVGAIIIGNVTIADHCVIGAGSVVTKSFLNPGTVIAGVPAKEISK